ncbi:hypothetical protein RP20_CCG012553 [Aedes albopictus]|nr:hypothetical protein RP20_CCG012553 [Aedes albopictus]
MLTNRVFMKKTRKGGIIKVVREHYLRDDIACGIASCGLCMLTESRTSLDRVPEFSSNAFTGPHYLMLDTNVILYQIDLLESDAIRNVIVLSTVLDEVRHRSPAIFKRLRKIVADPGRKFFTFVNEHHKETYLGKGVGESANDRNDRMIRRAAVWYGKHIREEDKENRVRVVVLTDDAENRRKAKEDGLLVASVADYVGSLSGHPELRDKVFNTEKWQDESKIIFSAHLTTTQIHEGIKKGELLQGAFFASRDNFLEGNVRVESIEEPVLIQGRLNLNRAVDGDVVAIKLLPKSEWKCPSGVVLVDEQAVDSEAVETADPEFEQKDGEDRVPTATVVGIIKRKWRQYCGILAANPMASSTRHLFIASDRNIPRIRIETRQSAHLITQKIVVAIDYWPRHSKYPIGHFVRALGGIGEKDTENEVILLEHDVPHGSFSAEIQAQLPKLPWTVDPEEYKKRVDLRDITICSVDPPGCTDIDDALHARRLDNGNIEVGVHIADVTHFIKPGTPLDKEAGLRATTVYLVDKRIDMVPDVLSSNLCSLRGGEERLAFSCIWELDDGANIINTKFHKSVIKSKAALTYQEAQLIIDDPTQTNQTAQSLRAAGILLHLGTGRRGQHHQHQEYFHYGLASPIYTHFTSPIRRYADVIVHRLLAACIGADATYPALLDKQASSQLCNNLNYRNRMAQYAGRASVALHTHLFFRDRSEDEEGYILFVKKNAIQVIIPKYGLEGTIYVAGKNNEKLKKDGPTFVYNEETQTQSCGAVEFHAFDPITVRLSLDSTNVQHQRLVFELVTPFIEGFSVPPLEVGASNGAAAKRKGDKAASETGEKATKKSKKGKF